MRLHPSALPLLIFTASLSRGSTPTYGANSPAPIFEASQVDRLPVNKTPPDGLLSASQMPGDGFAIVDFVVGTHGDVQSAHLIGMNDPKVGFIGLKTMSECRYTPGVKNGALVNTMMTEFLSFDLARTLVVADDLADEGSTRWDPARQLNDIFHRINTAWVIAHNSTSSHALTPLVYQRAAWVQYFVDMNRHQYAALRIIPGAHGRLACKAIPSAKDPAAAQLISYINRALADHPVSPELVHLIRSSPGFSIVLPLYKYPIAAADR